MKSNLPNLLVCIFFFAFILSGCQEGKPDKRASLVFDQRYSEQCIDGVVYIVTFKGSISAKFNPDSTVVTCK